MSSVQSFNIVTHPIHVYCTQGAHFAILKDDDVKIWIWTGLDWTSDEIRSRETCGGVQAKRDNDWNVVEKRSVLGRGRWGWIGRGAVKVESESVSQ